jgi:ketol-acid reductoisomerase
MSRVLRDHDADPDLLAGSRVGVVGYGNQGRAQALCLRDSGCEVRVFTRADGPSAGRAVADGLPPSPFEELAGCDPIAVLTPDETQIELLAGPIAEHAPAGALLVFAHGFALRAAGPDSVRSDLDLALVGPLGPGRLLRERFLDGRGLPALLAVVRDATGTAKNRALAWAFRLRATGAGVLETTLEEEVVSDLFAEQVVLVGGAVELVRAAWEVLVEDGVSEEIAYYSCVQELKQILDLVHEAGPAGMRERISGTAQWGGLTRGPRVLGDGVRARMRLILEEIRRGDFAEEWLAERAAGAPRLADLRAREAAHPLEEAGKRVRRELGDPGAVDSPPSAP